MRSEKMHLYIFFALMLATVWLFGKILWPYITVIAVSIVLAVLAYPLYQRLLRHLKYRGLASILTMLAVVLIILLPLLTFGTLVVEESINLIAQLRAGTEGSFSNSVEKVALGLEAMLPGLDVDVQKLASQGFALLTNNLTAIFSSAVHAFASVLIGLILFYYLLKDGNYFVNEITEKSPVGQADTRKVMDKFRVTIESVVRGNILMALVQGILTGVGFWLFGVPNASLWAGVAAIMALVPAVGTGLVLLGGLIYIYISSPLLVAVLFLAYSAMIVGLVDDVLRPYLIGRRANIHPILVLLSVVGGLAAFGPSGFILGPIILSLFIVVFEMYPEIVKE